MRLVIVQATEKRRDHDLNWKIRISLRPSFTSLHGEQRQHSRSHIIVVEALRGPYASFFSWQQFIRVEDEEGSPRKVAHNRIG